MINKQIKVKFQIGQFKSLKQIFCKFEGQIDLEGQGQQFLTIQDLKMINTQLRLKAEFPNGSKGIAFTKNYTKFFSFKANLTLKAKVKVTSFQTHLRH